MEQKQKITDEQIALFLSGIATEEDRESVYNYMSESNENLEELMLIAEAVSAQRKADADAKATVMKATPIHHRYIMPLHRFNHVGWRVAASVAVVLVVGSIVFALSNRGVGSSSNDGPMVAINTTPKEFPSNGDVENADNTAIRHIHHSMKAPQSSNMLAESESSSTNNGSFWDRYRLSSSKNTSTSGNSEKRNVMAYSQKKETQKKETKSSDTENSLDTLTPHVPEQCKAGDDMVISWECSMPNVVLEMRYGSRRIYYKEFPASQKSVVVSSNDLGDLSTKTDEIIWRMTVSSGNGRKSQEKTGIIKIIFKK